MLNLTLRGDVTSSKVLICGAYTLKHVSTGKMYHGSSKDIHRRKNEHLGTLRRREHANFTLQGLVNTDPVLELTIYPTSTIEGARELEQYLISRTTPEALTNVALDVAAGVGGVGKLPHIAEKLRKARLGNKHAENTRHTEEWKAQASLRLRGNKHLLGHRHSTETKRKMAIAHTGRKLSEESIRKSALGRIKGTVTCDGVTYESITEAARRTGFSYFGVKRRCKSPNYPTWIFNAKDKTSPAHL